MEQTYDRIIAYLKGLLTNRQKHDLEKRMMQDAFDEEAFEGLSQMPAEELQADMDLLTNRLQERINPYKRRYMRPVFRIAATFILLMGIAGILYLLLRPTSQELITQEIQPKAGSVSPETVPSVKQEATEETKQPGSHVKTKEIDQDRQAEAALSTEKPQEMTRTGEGNEVAGVNAGVPPQSPEAYRQKAAESVRFTPRAEESDLRLITGKVIGMDGEALPGVSVTEKGTSHGVITDIDGNFSIQVSNTGSELLLSYVGYESIELNAGDAAGKSITMTENLTALDEVVVVGYGTEKKDNETGAVSRLEAKDISPGGTTNTYSFINPVPPGGNLKEFKNWVSESLDSVIIHSFPGKHRIQAVLTVRKDGRIMDIRIRGDVPSPIIHEYKRVLAQSPPWTPALKNDEPVEAEIVIRFAWTSE